MDTRAAEFLLDEFEGLPGRISRPRTFMEIGGYPHYENVCSNFLAFFFDPEGPHGLGSLFLDALVGSVGIEGAEGEEGLGRNVSVEREVFTDAGNRIDILIKSDSHAMLIENKFYAAVDNPFEDYSGYLNRLKNADGEHYKNRIKILLTLYPSAEGSERGFVNVTHADFAEAVRSRLGHHISEADTRYLTLMLDFLNTLENMGEGTRMNQEFIDLLAKRSDEVEAFLKGATEVRAEVKGKAQALEERIDLQNHPRVWVILWQPNPNHQLVHLVQYRIRIDEESYAVVEPFVSPRGWRIRVFYRVSPKSQDHQEMRRLLDEMGIPPESEDFIRPERFAYNEELDGVAAQVEEELRRLAPICREVAEKVSGSSG